MAGGEAMMDAPVASGSGRLLTCRVGEQWLGMMVEEVREVVAPQPRTPMPLAPAAVTGLINLRGRVVTELDVRRIVGLPPGPEEEGYRVAIVETDIGDGGEDFGLVIDEVGAVIELDPDRYEPVPKTLPPVWRETSHGVLKRERDVVVLVDVRRLVARTLAESGEAMEGAEAA